MPNTTSTQSSKKAKTRKTGKTEEKEMTQTATPEKTALEIAFENARQEGGKTENKTASDKPVKKSRAKKTAAAVIAKEEGVQEAALPDETKEESQALSGDVFKLLIAARKAAEARLRRQEEEYAAILSLGDISERTGDIAQQLVVRDLAASGCEQSLQSALKLLDEQKAAILARLGIAPSAKSTAQSAMLRPLMNQPSPPLRQPEKAASVFAPTPVDMPAVMPAAPAPSAPFARGSIHELIQSIASYFSLYESEQGHTVRMRHIHQHFRDPAKIKAFLDIYEPSAWPGQFKYMYDNILIPRQAQEKSRYESAYSREEERADADALPLSTEALILRNMERMGL